jgi:hypothetical protein
MYLYITPVQIRPGNGSDMDDGVSILECLEDLLVVRSFRSSVG